MRMMGRFRTPGCCRGTCGGLRPGLDCSGGYPIPARYQRRIEDREFRREVAEVLSREVHDPLTDPSDCMHGCNGSPCTSERCTFVCHEEVEAERMRSASYIIGVAHPVP